MDDAIGYWVQLAEEDLALARDAHRTGHYLGAAFHCQQALEKMLKGLVQQQQADPPPRTHNLEELAKRVSAWAAMSQAQRDKLLYVDQYGIEGRYPTSEVAPLAAVDEAISQQLLTETDELMAWLRGRLDSGQGGGGSSAPGPGGPTLELGPVVQPSSDVLMRVERYLARLRAHVRVDAAWVFGSQVMGTTDAWSDVDLAVVSRDFGHDRQRDRSAVRRCRDPEEGSMDVLPFSWDEYVELPRGSFLREVLKHGRLVAGVPRPSSAEASRARASGDGEG